MRIGRRGELFSLPRFSEMNIEVPNEMVTTNGERELLPQPTVEALLVRLLKPLRVREVIVRKAGRYAIKGTVLTACMVERREFGEDFEIRMEEGRPGSVRSVIVGGRWLLRNGEPTGVRKNIARSFEGRAQRK